MVNIKFYGHIFYTISHLYVNTAMLYRKINKANEYLKSYQCSKA